MDYIIKSILPHLEIKLNVNLEYCGEPSLDPITTTTTTTTRITEHEQHIRPWSSSSVDANGDRLKARGVTFEPSFDASMSKASYVKIQDDLVKARQRLTSTQDELESLTKDLKKMTADISYHEEMNSERYRRYCFETHAPLYDYKSTSGYSRYIEGQKKNADGSIL